MQKLEIGDGIRFVCMAPPWWRLIARLRWAWRYKTLRGGEQNKQVRHYVIKEILPGPTIQLGPVDQHEERA